jgi:hypothetical protein
MRSLRVTLLVVVEEEVEEDILREHKKQRNYIIDLYRLLIQARDGMAYRKSVK